MPSARGPLAAGPLRLTVGFCCASVDADVEWPSAVALVSAEGAAVLRPLLSGAAAPAAGPVASGRVPAEDASAGAVEGPCGPAARVAAQPASAREPSTAQSRQRLIGRPPCPAPPE